MAASTQKQILNNLFLYENDEVVNVRVLDDRGVMTSVFMNNKQKLANFIAEIDDDSTVKAVFVQLQVIDPLLLNGLSYGKGVKRHHISRYRWLVVDVDTIRPNKSTSNATNDEKLNSLAMAQALHEHLLAAGWPPAVICDSGNGWHLVWRIDMKCCDESQRLLQKCLKALAAKFDNDNAEVDTTLAEPEQLIKLWGTMVRKGENTQERPWRRSGIVKMPDSIAVVPVELLQSLAQQAPAAKLGTVKRGDTLPDVDEDFDPEDFFEWCQENLPDEYQEFFFRDEEADHDENDGQHYVMDGCFWAERKHSGDRKKTEFILGKTFGFKCFSDDCDGIRIGDILRKVTRLAGQRYPGTIWPEDEDIYDDVDFVDDDVDEDDANSQTEVEDKLESPEHNPEHELDGTQNGVEDEDKGEVPTFVSKKPEAATLSGYVSETVVDVDPLAFPKDAMYGRLGQMAYAMSMPLGLAYPALVGTYSVMPDMDEMSATRINTYVILLAAPGGGKNEAIKRALAILKPPKELYKKSAPVSDRGLMSLIGHKVERQKNGKKEIIPGPTKLLLVTNEAANVLKKANIKNSSLGATLCEVWDENEYAPADRNGEQPCNCRLSWLGGLPIKRDHPEEFGEYFGRETGRGLLSRTILGFSDVKFNYRPWKAPDVWGQDEDSLIEELAFQTPSAVDFSEECLKMLDAWEPTDEEEAGRFKYNAKKVALLSASANGDKVVTSECMQAAIEFAMWQERLREVFKVGVAAENSLEAQFTEALMIALRQKGGESKHVNWRRLAHDRKWEERFGPRIVNTTVDNLIKSGTLEPYQYVREDEDGKKRVKTNPNKVKLREWKD